MTLFLLGIKHTQKMLSLQPFSQFFLGGLYFSNPPAEDKIPWEWTEAAKVFLGLSALKSPRFWRLSPHPLPRKHTTNERLENSQQNVNEDVMYFLFEFLGGFSSQAMWVFGGNEEHRMFRRFHQKVT